MSCNFNFSKTVISGLYEISPHVVDDSRGRFIKDYSKDLFELNGINHNISEIFYSSSHKGVIRGLHFQRIYPQPKLVRCIYGHIYDVVVDLRVSSYTFKKWIAFELTGDNCNEILVPAGCAHGFLVLDDSLVAYKCSENFHSEYDDGIFWNDSDLNIYRPLDRIGGIENVILSEKDANLQSFSEYFDKYGGF